jgi:hypothetical protein
MNFQRALAVAEAPISTSQLLNIYTTACSPTGCDSGAPTFDELATAANSVVGSSQAFAFRTLGVTFGVRH